MNTRVKEASIHPVTSFDALKPNWLDDEDPLAIAWCILFLMPTLALRQEINLSVLYVMCNNPLNVEEGGK